MTHANGVTPGGPSESNDGEIDAQKLSDTLLDLESRVEAQADRIDELERELQTKDALIDAFHKQLGTVKTVLAGSEDEYATWDAQQMQPLHARIVDLEDTVAEHEDDLEMVVIEDGSTGTPDERAQHLRRVLHNRAKQLYREDNHDGTVVAAMNRDECRSSLGGNLHRNTVLDAMKRAADGKDSTDPGKIDYTPVEGSCSLPNIDAIAFSTGTTIGDAEQSSISMELNSLTGTEVRQNLTTRSGPKGGSE